MALVQVTAATNSSLVELEDIGNSVECLVKLIDSQKELFHSQIDQLRRIVVTQCKVTGANPLSQEMAAGALSIKIGRRPRDLLNPKAIKYMQALFSIKDTIGKKETREISALCGITATQVRDYFTNQRSKVRKLVRLSQEKVTSCNASKATVASEEPVASNPTFDGCPSRPNQSLPASEGAPTDMSEHRIVGDCMQIPGNLENVTSLCTQSAASPVDVSGNLGYTQFPGNSVNVTTPCSQVLGNMENVTPLCAQAPGNLGNVSSVCTPVLGNLGNLSTVCTLVPGNVGIVYSGFPPVSGNLGNISAVCTPVATVSGYSEPVASIGTIAPGILINATPVQNGQQVHMKTNHKLAEEATSSSIPEESTPGVDSNDKKFLENIFSLMRKEQTFSGRVKLMEWVLQIHNSAVLSWFSTKGGITMLASWLSEAATEEQTTVLLVIFKVLCHLPLKTAQPVQMSAILQSVNKLRFYRNSDISNRAKVLLSRWSKMFVRSQALRNSRNSFKNGQKEMLQKQRTNGVLDDKSWPSKLDIPEDILAFARSTEDNRETEPNKSLKLLTESSDGSSRKHDRTVSTTRMKERRKVLLVEQPESKAGRSGTLARAVPLNTSRPMSTDDIQKAKMRASFMQDKYGKSNAPTAENGQNGLQKAEDSRAPPASQGNNNLPASKIPQQLPRRNEVKTTPVPSTKSLPNKPETSRNPKPHLTYQERLVEKLKRVQIPWRRPPEIKLHAAWRVCEGQNSKEVRVQTQRNKREKETIYQNLQEIPPDPKEPWDVEMDFDDSLTPEIPTDQPPDPDSPLVSPADNATNTSAAFDNPPSTSSNDAEPDAELLLVLLKNPEVVEALTKGEGKNLSQEQLVALLDMVKRAGTGVAGVLNGLANSSTREPESEPASLPSPTPTSDVSRAGWRSEFNALPSPSNVDDQQTFAPVAVYDSHNPATVTVNLPPQQHLPFMYLPHQQLQSPETQIRSNHYQVDNPGPFTAPIYTEPTADYWTNRANGDDPAKNLNYQHNQNNYNTNSSDMYPRRNDHVPESRASLNPQGLYGRNNYSEQPRRESDRSHEWQRQRQWNQGRDHQHRGGGVGGRWRRDSHRDYR